MGELTLRITVSDGMKYTIADKGAARREDLTDARIDPSQPLVAIRNLSTTRSSMPEEPGSSQGREARGARRGWKGSAAVVGEGEWAEGAVPTFSMAEIEASQLVGSTARPHLPDDVRQGLVAIDFFCQHWGRGEPLPEIDSSHMPCKVLI